MPPTTARMPMLSAGSMPETPPIDRSSAGLQYQRYTRGLTQTGEGSLAVGYHPGPVVEAQFRSAPQPRALSETQFGTGSNARQTMGVNNNA